jgi:uncharacterized protein (DUF2141 family)
MNLRTALTLAAAVCSICLARSKDSTAQPQGNCTLIIHATGFRNQKGVAGGTLFSSPNGWPEDNDKAYAHGPFPITGDHATLTFEHLPPRRYGVAILHDENSNHKLDRNFLRIPKEGNNIVDNSPVSVYD